MLKGLRLWVFSSLVGLAAQAAWTVEKVPLPRPGVWWVDPDRRLSPEARAEIDRLAQDLDVTGKGQVMVVVLSSLGGANPRSFATSLFNRLGVGHRGVDNGVLVFAALDDRKAELILGSGVDNDDDVARSDAIMQQEMVPRFKAGNPSQAMVAGARGAKQLLLLTQLNAGASPSAGPALAAERFPIPNPRPRGWAADLAGALSASQQQQVNLTADGLYARANRKLFLVTYSKAATLASPYEVTGWAREDLGLDSKQSFLLVVSVDPPEVELMVPLGHRADSFAASAVTQLKLELQQMVEAQRAAGLPLLVERLARFAQAPPPTPTPSELIAQQVEERPLELGLGGLGFLGAGGMALKRYLRRRPRVCQCGNTRELLDERSDDPHLNPGQRKEESLGSVDYDVWWCASCRDALVLTYGAIFTRQAKCGACGYVTANARTRTLVSATYDHGGTEEVTTTCSHCNHQSVATRHTARLTRPSSSSSSSSSGGGGSSSGRGSSGSW